MCPQLAPQGEVARGYTSSHQSSVELLWCEVLISSTFSLPAKEKLQRCWQLEARLKHTKWKDQGDRDG